MPACLSMSRQLSLHPRAAAQSLSQSSPCSPVYSAAPVGGAAHRAVPCVNAPSLQQPTLATLTFGQGRRCAFNAAAPTVPLSCTKVTKKRRRPWCGATSCWNLHVTAPPAVDRLSCTKNIYMHPVNSLLHPRSSHRQAAQCRNSGISGTPTMTITMIQTVAVEVCDLQGKHSPQLRPERLGTNLCILPCRQTQCEEPLRH